jgi:hypothetical protein
MSRMEECSVAVCMISRQEDVLGEVRKGLRKRSNKEIDKKSVK